MRGLPPIRGAPGRCLRARRPQPTLPPRWCDPVAIPASSAPSSSPRERRRRRRGAGARRKAEARAAKQDIGDRARLLGARCEDDLGEHVGLTGDDRLGELGGSAAMSEALRRRGREEGELVRRALGQGDPALEILLGRPPSRSWISQCGRGLAAVALDQADRRPASPIRRQVVSFCAGDRPASPTRFHRVRPLRENVDRLLRVAGRDRRRTPA